MDVHSRKVALHVSVYEKLHHNILTRKLKPNERLPGEHELANTMGVSRGTLRQALLLLQEDGFIRNRHGIGTFVNNQSKKLNKGLESSSIIAMEFSKFSSKLTLNNIAYEPATKMLEKKLEIEKDELVTILELLIYSEEKVVGLMDVFLPYKKFIDYDLSLKSGEEVERFLLEILDLNTSNSRLEIRMIKPREETRKLLEVSKEQTLVCFNEVMYYNSSEAIMYIKTICIPEYFDFYLNRRN